MLNPKEFQEDRRLGPLVPNQIPIVIETCSNLLLLSIEIEPVASQSLKAVELCGSLRL
jgi:hypothetical protein